MSEWPGEAIGRVTIVALEELRRGVWRPALRELATLIAAQSPDSARGEELPTGEGWELEALLWLTEALLRWRLVPDPDPGGEPPPALVELLAKAADEGSARAQFALGRLLLPRPRDATEGLRRLRLCAQGGLALAQYVLGEAYLRGVGVRPDQRVAALWLEMAATGGCLPAVFAISNLQLKTGDVPAAMEWACRALTLAPQTRGFDIVRPASRPALDSSHEGCWLVVDPRDPLCVEDGYPEDGYAEDGSGQLLSVQWWTHLDALTSERVEKQLAVASELECPAGIVLATVCRLIRCGPVPEAGNWSRMLGAREAIVARLASTNFGRPVEMSLVALLADAMGGHATAQCALGTLCHAASDESAVEAGDVEALDWESAEAQVEWLRGRFPAKATLDHACREWYELAAHNGSAVAAFALWKVTELDADLTRAANVGSADAMVVLGERARIDGVFSEAIRLFSAAAKKGQWYATLQLARAHEVGQVVQQNRREAERLYAEAVAAGASPSFANALERDAAWEALLKSD